MQNFSIAVSYPILSLVFLIYINTIVIFVILQIEGVMKSRWRCLRRERGLHYAPATAGKIVNAVVALHNFCLEHGEDHEIMSYIQDAPVVSADAEEDEQLLMRGETVRNEVIQYIFSRRIRNSSLFQFVNRFRTGPT